MANTKYRKRNRSAVGSDFVNSTIVRVRMYGGSCFLLDVVLANLAELPGPVNPIPQGSSQYCFGSERLD
jgi:hypothetical protein